MVLTMVMATNAGDCDYDPDGFVDANCWLKSWMTTVRVTEIIIEVMWAVAMTIGVGDGGSDNLRRRTFVL